MTGRRLIEKLQEIERDTPGALDLPVRLSVDELDITIGLDDASTVLDGGRLGMELFGSSTPWQDWSDRDWRWHEDSVRGVGVEVPRGTARPVVV